MKMSKNAIIALSAIILGTTSLTASARTSVDIIVNIEPPAMRYEVVPVARHGHMWIPGYWNWNGRRHVWVEGHFEKVRNGYVYVEPSWQRTDRGWHLARGEWKKNYHGHRSGRGRDGVSNRFDKHPNNLHRHGHLARRDKDGDGIPNHFDNRPNNPHRH